MKRLLLTGATIVMLPLAAQAAPITAGSQISSGTPGGGVGVAPAGIAVALNVTWVSNRSPLILSARSEGLGVAS